jgi:2TM domain
MTVEDVTRVTDDHELLRERAVKQLKKKRDFHAHLVVFVLVNTFLVGIWAITDSGGFFWPMFPIGGWAIGLVMNGWDVYRGEDFTEDDIRREMVRLRSR